MIIHIINIFFNLSSSIHLSSIKISLASFDRSLNFFRNKLSLSYFTNKPLYQKGEQTPTKCQHPSIERSRKNSAKSTAQMNKDKSNDITKLVEGLRMGIEERSCKSRNNEGTETPIEKITSVFTDLNNDSIAVQESNILVGFKKTAFRKPSRLTIYSNRC